MKKLLILMLCILSLYGCTADHLTLNQVSYQKQTVGSGSIGIRSTKVSRTTVEEFTWENVGLICNTVVSTSGTNHAESGIAVRDSYTGYNVCNNENLLLTGDNFDDSRMTKLGDLRVISVGNAWIDNYITQTNELVTKALTTEKHTGYYLKQDGSENTGYPYTYYEYNGYKYIIVEYNEADGYMEAASDWTKYDIRAPWCKDNPGSWTDTSHVILMPNDGITFAGREINASIFAPGKTISLLNGGSVNGFVVCDNLILSGNTEIHGTHDTPFTVPTDDCSLDVEINIEVPGEYIIQADDFAIHNGDKLYVPIPSTAHASQNDYVVVTPGNNTMVSLNDICSMYEDYVGVTDPDGIPYISESGVLSIECWIWPGKIVNGRIQSLSRSEMNITSDTYVIGTPYQGRIYENDKYRVEVSAYKLVNDSGVAAVHVTFHISKK